jgi:hypothetical protein
MNTPTTWEVEVGDWVQGDWVQWTGDDPYLKHGSKVRDLGTVIEVNGREVIINWIWDVGIIKYDTYSVSGNRFLKNFIKKIALEEAVLTRIKGGE